MILSIKIPHEIIFEAEKAIRQKEDICDILPKAEFYINNNGDFEFAGLICDDRMGGKKTGMADFCKNCLWGKVEVEI